MLRSVGDTTTVIDLHATPRTLSYTNGKQAKHRLFPDPVGRDIYKNIIPEVRSWSFRMLLDQSGINCNEQQEHARTSAHA